MINLFVHALYHRWYCKYCIEMGKDTMCDDEEEEHEVKEKYPKVKVLAKATAYGKESIADSSTTT